MGAMSGTASNREIKSVAALHKRSEREKTGRFLIEGGREIDLALLAGIELEAVYVLDNVGTFAENRVERVVEVSASAFERIAYGRDGLVAVARRPRFGLEELNVAHPAIILVLDAIEKPGNLGAVLRSADATGAAVLVADDRTDLTNPNIVRASLGTLFTVPVASASSSEVIRYLRDRAVTIAATMVVEGIPPWRADLTKAVAFVIGSENRGISQTWIEAADIGLSLPMRGAADSLNASATAAVMLFEAIRQRSPR